ncbi:hypothetical protein KY290_014223 [Solanum tuberosum]|uniref:Uncharacterized protein n=1 Tax=Solanum tuberosum TaxID=4113 RepID=A0ABQ7VP07_SOLTU|nr:hypothetical protein KY284_013615 [Solanum tuberosum]KAH0770242.1 hypothetical protein KY290_014223 [Solanum tuberosum]
MHSDCYCNYEKRPGKISGPLCLTTHGMKASKRCGASLVFASIGAGIGAMIVHPTTGQWIGCAI